MSAPEEHGPARRPATGGKRATQVVTGAVAFIAVTLALIAACEGGARLVGRLRTGSWPKTQAATFFDLIVDNVTLLYRTDPWLNAAPRAGAHTTSRPDLQAGFNSLGYRSPERPLAKPPGVRRIVCAGGSTTFDVTVTTDEHSWPWQLEERLAGVRPPVEVWNAGFPGWTSLENAISLVVRDLDLRPDVIVLYQGINDLQPAAAVPFSREYDGAHPAVVRQSLVLDPPHFPLWERSVFIEQMRTLLFGPRQFSMGPVARVERVQRIPDEAVDTFRRNVRSILALARGVGARVVFATQPLRIRAGHEGEDRYYVEHWIPGLAAAATPGELERLHDVLRSFDREPDVTVIDVAHDVPWADEDFKDAMHFSDAGSAKLATFLAPRIAPLVEDGAS